MKWTAAERMLTQRRVEIAVLESEIRWEEEGKEFEMSDGRMFDVDSWHSSNGCVYAKGVWDSSETLLLRWLCKLGGKRGEGSWYSGFAASLFVALLEEAACDATTRIAVTLWNEWLASCMPAMLAMHWQPPRL